MTTSNQADPNGVLALAKWTVQNKERIEKEARKNKKLLLDFLKSAKDFYGFNSKEVRAYIKAESYFKPQESWTIEEDVYFTHKACTGSQFSGLELQEVLNMTDDDLLALFL